MGLEDFRKNLLYKSYNMGEGGDQFEKKNQICFEGKFLNSRK